MTVLYINQYFRTPKESGSTRSYWVSQELIKNSHQLVMVCHSNQLLDGKQDKIIKTTIVDGIKVISIKNSYSNSMGAFERIMSFLKFMVFSTYVVLKEKNVDLVFASSTPLTIAFPALMRKWLRGTKFVFEVRDLWPEAPIQLGFIKNKLAIKFLRWFEKTTYKNASHIIALSPGMQAGVVQYVAKEKTSMIPNMAKIDKFWPRPSDSKVNDQFHLSQSTFKLVYFGTMGMANGIDYLMEAIQILEKRQIQNLEFIFMGEGAKKKDLVSLSSKLSVIKVSVLDRQPMDNVSSIVNNSDVSVCTFSNIPILKTNSPNKLFDSLSAGKASIVNSDGWTKDIVEDYKCGLYASPTDPSDFADKVIFLIENPATLSTMGSNARKLAEDKFDKSYLCKQVKDVLEQQ
mgnify:FL=1